MLPKKLKLKTEDFKKPFKNIWNGDFLIIKKCILPSPITNLQSLEIGNTQSRYGIVISKKVSKLATQRNKYKRLLFSLLNEKILIYSEDLSGQSLSNKKIYSSLFLIQLKKVIPEENINDIKDKIKLELENIFK